MDEAANYPPHVQSSSGGCTSSWPWFITFQVQEPPTASKPFSLARNPFARSLGLSCAALEAFDGHSRHKRRLEGPLVAKPGECPHLHFKKGQKHLRAWRRTLAMGADEVDGMASVSSFGRWQENMREQKPSRNGHVSH